MVVAVTAAITVVATVATTVGRGTDADAIVAIPARLRVAFSERTVFPPVNPCTVIIAVTAVVAALTVVTTD